MIYTAAFNVVESEALLSLGTITCDRLSGSPQTITVTFASLTATAVNGDSGANTFWVWSEENFANPDDEIFSITDQSPRAAQRFAHFARNTFAGALTIALRAQATAGSWTQVPRVTWSAATGSYTVALYTSLGALTNCSYTWSTAGGLALMGFTANQSGSTNYTSSVMPLYVIDPTLPDTSEPTTNYEPDAIGSHAMTDTGAGHGLARYVSPLYRDWRQEYETKAKTLRLSAAAAHPWTFQHLFEHCRGIWPFLVYTTGLTAEAFSFRESGIPFHPIRATPGNDAQFHLPFETVVGGTTTHFVIPQ